MQSFLSFATNQPYYNIPAVGASAHEVLCIAEFAVCQPEHGQDIWEANQIAFLGLVIYVMHWKDVLWLELLNKGTDLIHMHCINLKLYLAEHIDDVIM